MNAGQRVSSGTPPTRVPLPSAQRGDPGRLCSLTTSCLGFPLSTESASPDHRGVTCCEEQRRERSGAQGGHSLPFRSEASCPTEHGNRAQAVGRRGHLGGDRQRWEGNAEQEGLQERGATAACGSRPGLAPPALAPLDLAPPALALERPPFTERGSSSPTTVTRKGRSRKTRHRVETLSSQRLLADRRAHV